MELIPSVQTYDWGKKGKSSLVGNFAKNVIPNFQVEDDKPYAEFWMGTHPNGPSVLKDTLTPLQDFIKTNPMDILGPKVFDKFGPELPFLFKVLSVNKALSIQAHPDKKLGAQLHSSRPDLYKDPNHKPEMAVALTPFELLCGFRRMEEIIGFLKSVEELANLVGKDNIQALEDKRDKPSLQKVFRNLMKAKDEDVVTASDKLLLRLESMSAEQRESLEGNLVKRLATQFPCDVGIFCVYFLQHIILKEGQAVFLSANEPHAYIYGDCIECMAASDNTLRAGLTPKFKDVATLCSMLSYETGKNWILNGIGTSDEVSNTNEILYDPPVEEFAVRRYIIESPTSLRPHLDSCSVLICVEGTGTAMSTTIGTSTRLVPGSTLFVPYKFDQSSLEIVPNTNRIVVYEAFSTP